MLLTSLLIWNGCDDPLVEDETETTTPSALDVRQLLSSLADQSTSTGELIIGLKAPGSGRDVGCRRVAS